MVGKNLDCLALEDRERSKGHMRKGNIEIT